MKSLERIIKKDADKLNKEFAKGKIYIAGLIKEQEAIIKFSEKRIKNINKELKPLQEKLRPYLAGEEVDSDFLSWKMEYERLLQERFSLHNAISVASESIEEAKLMII